MRKVLFLVLILLACESKKLVPMEKLVKVISEIEISHAYINQGRHSLKKKDSLKQIARLDILKQNNVDKALMDSTMQYYYKNIDAYQVLLEKISDNIKEIESEVNLKLNPPKQEKSKKDSVDVSKK
jgi:hypothetical protein